MRWDVCALGGLAVGPPGKPYPVLVEGPEHALHVLAGIVVACDLEKALELVHEERAAGTLHQKPLVPLLELGHVHLAGPPLLPAELLSHLRLDVGSGLLGGLCSLVPWTKALCLSPLLAQPLRGAPETMLWAM